VRLYGLVSLIVAAALLMFASPAAAQSFDCSKQEEVAVSDQYCPPASTGPEGDPMPPKPPLGEQLPPRIVQKLEREGAAGKAVLELARVAPAAVVNAQTGGRAKKVVDAERLLAIGALGTPMKPESAAKILAKTATLGEGFAETFRWGLLGMTFLLVGASWLRYRARSLR
jgi:hypothetical protein